MVDERTMRSDMVPANADTPVIDATMLVVAREFIPNVRLGIARYAMEHPKWISPDLAIGQADSTASLPWRTAIKATLGIVSMRDYAIKTAQVANESSLPSGMALDIGPQKDIFERQARAIGAKALSFTKPKLWRMIYPDVRKLRKSLKQLG